MAYYPNQNLGTNNFLNYILSNNQLAKQANQIQQKQLQQMSQIQPAPQIQQMPQLQQTPQLQQLPNMSQLPKTLHQQQNQLNFSQLSNKVYLNNGNQNLKGNLNTPQVLKNQYSPPLSPSGKKILVLDLDETLVHASFDPPTMRPADFVFNAVIDQVPRTIHVLIRPYAEQFLIEIANYYDIVVFTSSIPEYADVVINKIDKYHVVKKRLFRTDCDLNKNGLHLKDLKKLGRDLKDIVIIDNCPVSYELNEDNGIPIEAWYSDLEDNELIKFLPFLKFLSKVDDVRPILRQVVNRFSDTLNYDLIGQMMNKSNANNNLNITRLNQMQKMKSDRVPEFNAVRFENTKTPSQIRNINTDIAQKNVNNNAYNNMNLTSNNLLYFGKNGNIGNIIASIQNGVNQQNQLFRPVPKSARVINRNVRKSVTPDIRPRHINGFGLSTLRNDYPKHYTNYIDMDAYNAPFDAVNYVQAEYAPQSYGYITSNLYVNTGTNPNYYVASGVAPQQVAINYQYI